MPSPNEEMKAPAPEKQQINRSLFWGLALTAGSTLMLETVLTRIFSVIMWYHMSLVSVGLLMGMFFQTGVRLVEKNENLPLAWYWAVNGAASTCAAVYSICLSISYGITFTYWVGVACYIVAGILGFQYQFNRKRKEFHFLYLKDAQSPGF